ncbi:MAG: Asp-tRNA(Asn)/Glu-tRNA(Gln) amidotransferase subunit GatC [Phycisphaerales bacterium]|nr:Asp-tRNA(Asn)/Glu-tRNA(Gln) amidotransferase subunit GatC [Phycisphaerales bacterium]
MASEIDEQQVRHIGHLARIKLTDEEVTRFGSQLGNILDYIGKLNEVDTDDVEPTAHPLPVKNVFREDVPATSMGVEKALANAPDKTPPYFKVPKVLDQESA